MRNTAALVLILGHLVLALGACSKTVVGTGSGGGDRTGDGTGTEGEGTASASSCETACSKLIVCGPLQPADRASCMSTCVGSSSSAVDCILTNDCAGLLQNCAERPGGEGNRESFEVSRCQSACDRAQFFSCLDASMHADCRARCTSVSAEARDSYVPCVDNAASDCAAQADCYAELQQ